MLSPVSVVNSDANLHAADGDRLPVQTLAESQIDKYSPIAVGNVTSGSGLGDSAYTDPQVRRNPSSNVLMGHVSSSVMRDKLIPGTASPAPESIPMHTSGLISRDYSIVVSDDDDNISITTENNRPVIPAQRVRKARKRKRKGKKHKTVNFAEIEATIGTRDNPVRIPTQQYTSQSNTAYR